VLAGLGLIERVPDPGRAHVLVVIEEGRRRLEATRTARRERRGTWPVDDVRLMAHMLARSTASAPPTATDSRQPLHPHEQPFGQEQLEPCPQEQLRIIPLACGERATTARQTMVTFGTRSVKPDRVGRSPRKPLRTAATTEA
jgi:hypothetical protein